MLKGSVMPAGALWLQKPYTEGALGEALASLLRPGQAGLTAGQVPILPAKM